MQPGRYTELFFLDEATALAAGHRPCAECRREDYVRFAAFWSELHGDVGVDAIDARLHEERVQRGTRARRFHEANLAGLPDGAFVLHDGEPHLVLGSLLVRWRPEGYAARVPRPHGVATLITPPSLVELLRRGWKSALPLVHPSGDL